jgi:hypothetical protein
VIRNDVPLEVISKVIFWYQYLKTTQMYLGRIGEGEALHWMDVLNGKQKKSYTGDSLTMSHHSHGICQKP